MTTAPRNGSARTLTYANAPTRLGLVHEPLSDGVRITRPARLGRVAGAVAMAVLAVPLVMIAVAFYSPPAPFFRRIHGWSLPTVLEVSGTRLFLQNVNIDGAVQDVERARDAVYEVKYVAHSGNLVIRARGRDIIDFRPVDNPAALEWIAGLLREALGLSGGPADHARHPAPAQ